MLIRPNGMKRDEREKQKKKKKNFAMDKVVVRIKMNGMYVIHIHIYRKIYTKWMCCARVWRQTIDITILIYHYQHICTYTQLPIDSKSKESERKNTEKLYCT